MAWCYRGSKVDFIDILLYRTGISANVLSGRTELINCSVAERLSWAAKRTTTRLEDIAYSLLGLFNVNMPLLYGEGPKKAFRRLQEEIIKVNNDLTIFAWEAPDAWGNTTYKLFAESPEAFVNSYGITPFGDDCEDFSVTNKGLLVSGEAPLREVSLATPDSIGRVSRYALFVGLYTDHVGQPDGGIYLRKIGPKLFIRDPLLLAGFLDPNFDQLRVLDDMTDYYILADPKPNISPLSFRDCALHVPANDTFELEDAVPETLWDVTDRLFLKPKPYNWIRYPMVIALEFRGVLLQENMELVVLCLYKEGDLHPTCKVFWRGTYPREESIIFQHRRNRRESIYWSQLELDAPHILEHTNKVERSVGRKLITISAYFEKGIVPSITGSVELFSLKLDVSVHDPAEI